MKRHYLHPITTPLKLRVKDFSPKSSGTTSDGTRLTAFEARNPAISQAYRFGIQIEPPGQQQSMMIFGDYNDIHAIEQQIKSDLAGVLKAVRPLGKSQFYRLNRPPSNEPVHTDPGPERAKAYADAQRMFPDHDSKYGLTDRATEEKRALKAHQRKLAEAREMYPDSRDGASRVEAALKPPGQPGTLLTEAIE